MKDGYWMTSSLDVDKHFIKSSSITRQAIGWSQFLNWGSLFPCMPRLDITPNINNPQPLFYAVQRLIYNHYVVGLQQEHLLGIEQTRVKE